MARISDQTEYICRNCQNPVALRSDLLSKNYLAKSGQAYFFSHAMNVIVGQKEDKQLISGLFSIADIKCSNCKEVLGWKYVKAYEDSQRFKEGKFILELAKIAKFY